MCLCINYHLFNAIHNEATTLKQMARYTSKTQLTPVNLEPIFLCNRGFGRWWNEYYTEEFYEVPSFIQHIDKAFLSVQERTKKCTHTLIKEIQAFQIYFETAYKPDDLSRTIREADVTLKEKLQRKWKL